MLTKTSDSPTPPSDPGTQFELLWKREGLYSYSVTLEIVELEMEARVPVWTIDRSNSPLHIYQLVYKRMICRC